MLLLFYFSYSKKLLVLTVALVFACWFFKFLVFCCSKTWLLWLNVVVVLFKFFFFWCFMCLDFVVLSLSC